MHRIRVLLPLIVPLLAAASVASSNVTGCDPWPAGTFTGGGTLATAVRS